MKALNLILNADDFGYSKEVNDAVIQSAQSGSITSVSMLANGPATLDALQRIGELASVSVGVHLNVTEFSPLLHTQENDCLVDDLGSFNLTAPVYYLSPKSMLAIYREWSSQVEHLLRMGVKLTHIDSHNHIHTYPALMPVVLAVGRKYQIRRIRNAHNCFQPNHRYSRTSSAYKSFWAHSLKLLGRYRLTDYFLELQDLVSQKSDFGRGKSAEVMLHPGHRMFQNEEHVFKRSWIGDLPFPAKLIRWEDV
jgi:predicted glycoside hydrolase/deacetylase ChbG (UPF0249 family)